MIIYPLLILVLLLFAFVIVYRRAYILESGIDPLTEKKLEKRNANTTKPDIKNNALNRAEKLFKKKRYISAEKWFIEAAKVDPKNDAIYAKLGVIYIEQKNYIDAIEALVESVKYRPDVGSRWYNLSYAQYHSGRFDEAIDSAKKAVKSDTSNEKYNNWLDQLKKKPH